MAPAARNLNYRTIADVMTYATATGTVFNEGDLVYLDTGTGLIAPISSGTQVPYMLGNVQGSQPTSYTQGNVGLTSTYNVYVTRHTVKLIARDVGNFISGVTPVYFSTDAQSFKIASGSESNILGVMAVNPKEFGGVPSGTTVVNQEYEVLLRASYLFAIA